MSNKHEIAVISRGHRQPPSDPPIDAEEEARLAWVEITPFRDILTPKDFDDFMYTFHDGVNSRHQSAAETLKKMQAIYMAAEDLAWAAHTENDDLPDFLEPVRFGWAA